MLLHRSILLALFLPCACQTTPRLTPLPVHDVFAVDYTGDIGPLVDGDMEQLAPEPSASLASTTPVSFRGTIVALPCGEVTALLPGLLGDSGAPAGAHVDAAALRHRLADLAARGLIRSAPLAVVGLGNTVATTLRTRTAYVGRFDVSPMAGRIMANPQVARFEHGSQLSLTPRRGDAGLQLELEWRVSEPVLPIPQVRTRSMKLQVPVLQRHCLRVATAMAEHDAFVLGPLPGSDDDSVAVLFVEVDGGGALAAAK